MKKIISLLFLLPFFIFSQTKEEKLKIVNQCNIPKLKEISVRNVKQFFDNKLKAIELAKQNNWKLFIKTDSTYSELVGVSKDLKPIYYQTENRGAGMTSRANKLYDGGGLGLNIEGQNMTAGVWDAAAGLASHELFEGRLQVMDGTTSTHYHSTHVAGTIIGSDQFQNGLARGMAFKGNVNSYDWNNDVSEVAIAASNGLLISSHSYGINPYYVSDYQWGKYDLEAQNLDDIMFNAPYYEYVCAAGNSRGSYNTIKNGYDLLTSHTLSKNGITVAAVSEVANYTGPNSVAMSYFSSWGPTDDGRIKPDICAKGVDTFSSVDASNSSYDTLSGTSMASPSVAGTLLLLQQYYNQMNGSFMRAATLRGLMIHTADETGVNDGPDYGYGWGLINAEKAANVITKKQTQSYILENTLNQGGNYSISVNSIGTEPLVATLCWTDPKGNLASATIDDATPTLINDLDIRITKNSETHFPWKLDVANPTNAATQEDNIVDNVEKVEVNNPSGSYNVTVSHKGTLLNNLQNYSLIISGITVHDFWFTTSQTTTNLCLGTTATTLNYALNTKSNFSDVVNFSLINLPAGITGSFSPSSMSAAGNFSINLSNLGILAAGEYNFIIKGISSNDIFEMPVTIKILATTFSTVSINSPLNNAISVSNPVAFSWVADNNAQQYDIQIASDIAFNTIVENQTVSTNSYSSTSLLNGTSYYWRIKSKNSCGVGLFSSSFHFTTACSLPNNIHITNTGLNSVTIGWTDNSNSSSWEYIVVPQATTPGTTGTITATNPVQINGLVANTCYDFYVRSICSIGTSVWTNLYNFCTQPDYCNGNHFYDTGGSSGNYHNGETYIKTIYPNNPGERVKAIFNSFNVEGGYDYLTVYNGNSTASPLLNNLTGSYIPSPIASTDTSGALTFQFYSDSIIAYSGWDISILCEPMPPCPITPSNAIFNNNATTTTASFSWNSNNSSTTSWQYVIVPTGSLPSAGTPITTVSNPVTAINLTPNTCYDFYVRNVCTAGNSDWSNFVHFCTEANYCGGDHFYDAGGVDGNYPIYQYYTKTIYPDSLGNRVKAIFNTFQLNQYDDLYVFNGPSTGYPQIANCSGTNSPGTVASTDVASGALTFVFYGYSGNSDIGWDASIICEPMPPCPNVPTNIYINNITQSTIDASWYDYNNNSWEYQVVPHGTPPVSSGTIINLSQIHITGLIANTCYDFYLRARCTNGNSDWTSPYNFCTEPDYCGNHFYDAGGANGNYPTYQYYTKTIYPNSSVNRVKAIFNSFQLNQNDNLYIYNGPNSNYPLISNASGTNSPGTVASTDLSSGALTFVFYGYSGYSDIGWDASIVCEPMPPCPNPPGYIYNNTPTYNSVQFYWYDYFGNTSWEYTVMPQDVLPGNSGTLVSSTQANITGLTSNTCYDFYVRAVCSGGVSDWSRKVHFCTDGNYCGGDHYYDTGGANGNYQPYEYINKTVYPNNAGDRVKAIFNTFQLNPNDSFQIYSGSNLIFSYNGTNSPGTVASTDINSGALSFYFSSNYNSSNVGWDATIVCEPMPPCPNPPSNIYVYSQSYTSASANWYDNSNANTWEYCIVPQGTAPTTTGTLTNSTYLNLNNLTSNTCYSFYVRSVCPTANSDWSLSYDFCTNGNYCAGDHFYDDGGVASNYHSNQYYTKTIYPDSSGNRVRAVFNSFHINPNDTFYIYNGPNTGYPLLFSGTGTNSPGNVVSTDTQYGALTFVLYTYSNLTDLGWDATITCEPIPPCSVPPSNVQVSYVSQTTATCNWTENLNSTTWEISVVPQGSNPGVTTLVTTKPYQITGLTLNTCYSFYVRSKCTSGTSSWVGPFNFCTDPDLCGNHFYDTGGSNGNYQNSENYTKTIYPDVAGDHVSVTFNSFSSESCCDYLRIYNGPNTSSPLLFTAYGSNYPSTLTSTHSTGALTFAFSSDSSVVASGWDISVYCQMLANDEHIYNSDGLYYYPNPIENMLNVNSKTVIKSYVVYDVNLRLIQSGNCDKNEFTIDLKNYSSGFYFIKMIDDEDKSKEIKVIKN